MYKLWSIIKFLSHRIFLCIIYIFQNFKIILLLFKMISKFKKKINRRKKKNYPSILIKLKLNLTGLINLFKTRSFNYIFILKDTKKIKRYIIIFETENKLEKIFINYLVRVKRFVIPEHVSIFFILLSRRREISVPFLTRRIIKVF